MEDFIKAILIKEKISYNNISKSTVGYNSLVYFIDDKFVIKISKDETTKKKLHKEISIYKNIKLECIPKYITSGVMQGYLYLIISKVKGNSLYSIWHTLSKEERQSCIKQIARILKVFNNKDTDFLDAEYKDLNWITFLSNELTTKSKILTKMGFNVTNIDNFISHELPIIFKQNKYGLVYNDAHFDNFIYDNGKLKLIDFDRVRVCPIDYEMLIFKTMCDNPRKFASEKDEDKIKDDDYIGIYQLFQSEYPEMFVNENIDKRISVYQFNYLIGQAIQCNDSQWIIELLDNFIK